MTITPPSSARSAAPRATSSFSRWILLALLCLPTARPAWCAATPHPSVAKRGVLDLREQAGAPNVVLDLEGEWEFYWGRLLEPGAFRAPSTPPPIAYAPVPGTWSGWRSEGEPLPPEGYATYRLRVRGVRPGDPLAIRISTPLSAFALWLDGQPVPTGSHPGTDRSTETPGEGLILASWVPTADTTEIVLQVSNHVYRDGGVPVAPWFGSRRQVERRQHLRWLWGVFLVGILVAMAAYHFVLFGLRRQDRSPLYLGLYCLLWSIESAVSQSTDGLAQLIWPSLSWTTLYRVDLVAYYLSVPVVFGFLAALYPREMFRGVVPTWVVAGAAFSVAHLVLPLRSAAALVPYYHLLSVVGMVLAIVTLVRAVVRGRDGARILLCGFALVIAAGVNDMLHDLGVIHTADLVPLGLVGFTLFQSFALSRRSAHAFATVARLSREIDAKNRELSRLDRLKDEFLATTSHELRTPLTGIIGLSEALLGGASGVLPRIAGEHLHLIAASGRRLAALVSDLLDFSRLKNRDLRLNSTAIDLRSVVEVVLTISRPLVGDRPVTLHNDIGPDTPPARGDEDRLQQILHNLVGNAIKFTSKGQIRVGVRVHGPLLEVSVTDTGTGISAADLAVIFEPFEQGEGDATRDGGGTGLGLTITRKLVELHGGSLAVDSTVDRGSRFHFTLPVSTETAETAVPAVLTPVVSDLNDPATPVLLPPSTDPEPISDPEARVLVVDDDPVNLRVVAGHLALGKIVAHTVADGLSALEILETGPQPDLVLLDAMMPGINGFEVCRRLRKRFSSPELPVVLLTARNRLQDLVEGFAAGANDYLVKPFSKDELLARVRAQVQVKRAFESVRENARLRRELEHRRQSERALRVLQRRLAHLLDAVDDPVIAVNEAGEICFCNRSGQALFGREAGELLGLSPEQLFPGAVDAGLSFTPGAGSGAEPEPGATRAVGEVAVQRGDGRRITLDVLVSSLNVDDEILFVLLLREPRPSTDGVPLGLAVVEELNRNRLRLQDLENSLNAMAPRVAENSPAFFEQLRAIDRALEQLAGRVAIDGDRRRVLAVELLKLALGCWVEATGETKADLARRSGLWTVYTNRDGWERTQTLDRYLDHPTLPLRPRWRLIERTAEFVLAVVEPGTLLSDRLEPALEEFRVCR